MAASRLGIPIILEINGNFLEEYAHLGIQLSAAQWKAIGFVTKQMFSRATHIVVVDDALKQWVVLDWHPDPAKVCVIANGTDYELFSSTRDSRSIRERYHLPDGPIIAYVGNFSPWQGADVLVRSFGAIRRHVEDALLLLVGDGPQKSDTLELVRTMSMDKHVVFMGQLEQDRVADILAISDVAAAPYQDWSQAIGLKVFDYMAAGKAIVTTARDRDHPVLVHMHTGYLVEPGDEEQLSLALLLLLRDDALREKLGMNAQQQARASHTWDQTVDKIENLIQDLCSTKRTPARAATESAGSSVP